MSDSVRPHRRQPNKLPRPWDSLGKNTGVGCHFLLQCVKVKSLSGVRLLATPWNVAYQAPPSMGFSKQEYWSGLPFPSPVRESEVAQSCPTLCDPMDYSLPGSSVHEISRQEYWSELPYPLPGDLPNPGIKPRSPALQEDSLPSEPPGKPWGVNRYC